MEIITSTSGPHLRRAIAIGFYTMNWDESKGIVVYVIGPSLWWEK